MKTLSLQYVNLSISLTLVALNYLAFGNSLKMALLLPLAIASGPLFMIDATTKRLPNEITYPAIATTMAIVIVAALFLQNSGVVIDSTAKGLAFFLLFLILYMVTRGGIGAGDAKLSLLIGLSLGPFRTEYLLAVAILAFSLSALYSTAQLIRREVTLQSKIPFGPFLIAATWSVILLPQSLLGLTS